MSISRYIEWCVEEKRGDEDDDGLEYLVEDVLPEAREAKEEVKSGKLKMYNTAEEMFEALGV